ncbi:hypothetical protein [Solidesulfovibrio magneticus]|uniref:Hypothetical membrane protein n=1 Tax=Solidesulfovibrio magneticus (strain ATCC 700980 / DSM 13731 / RS-1) TaxID=573370 RepID=C4XNG2_SOLM1|nr:hypothetical protein [Solidesulfovibrio magneticus]BAH74937.1 hypothetical membrane protein [Solidesulfovibrio magneticus RS-1]
MLTVIGPGQQVRDVCCLYNFKKIQSWYSLAFYSFFSFGIVYFFYGEFIFSDRVGALDWRKDLFYFHFLYDSLHKFGVIPVSFLAIPSDIAWFSTLQDLSYWSNPEVISLSPFLPLAYVMSFMAFMKAYFAAHIFVAVWGVRFLAARTGLGTVQTMALLVLFLLNPWLVQHLAIGYTPQISLCLVPLLVALLISEQFRPIQLAGASLVAAWIFYQGALHLFVWLCMAMGVTIAMIALLGRRADVLWRAAFFFMGTLILVLPKVYAVSKVYGVWERFPAVGYASLTDVWGLLTDDSFPMFLFPETYTKYNVAFYDGSLLVGSVFVLLVVWLVFEYLSQLRIVNALRLRDGVCLLAASVFFLLGWNTIWRTVSGYLLLSSSEIYPFRFLFVAYNFMIFFVVDRIGRCHARFSGRIRNAVIYAALTMTCLTFYDRNRELMPYLTENPNFYGDFSISEFYSNRIVAQSGQTLLPVTATPTSVTIIPAGVAGHHILLPWLPWGAVGHHMFHGARPLRESPYGGTVIEVTSAASPVVIEPDSSSRGMLLTGVSLFFAGFVVVTTFVHRKWVVGSRPTKRQESR